jgi:hypothetical protein
MAHTVSHSAYRQLTDRLNRFPQGAPQLNCSPKY